MSMTLEVRSLFWSCIHIRFLVEEYRVNGCMLGWKRKRKTKEPAANI